MERQYDLVIIGAGPAGMAASVYGSRAGLKTLLLDNGAPGGKLIKTHKISNYPGVKELSGVELATSMFEQSTSFGAEYAYGDVEKVDADKKVTLSDGTIIEAKAVIVATGTKERLLKIPGEQENIGRGVSFCAVCDGAFFKNKDVVVIGGGNSALEESLFLTQFANKVTIVIRRDVFRAEKKIQEQIQANDKIEVIVKHIPKEILAENGKVSGIVFENVETKEPMTLSCQGIFPYVGQDPNTVCLEGLGVLDDKGYVIVDDSCQTKIPGLYAAGDVIQKELRQVVTATNDGAIAAQHAFHQITGI
ncbi:thioredoxin-disulfide reductase [Faecalicoccus acidiformans]|uniref:Thioredoxin reductase n=2 Tax=Faecalicoccus TaxID=1573536 RepID=A0ABS2FMS1_9FIRM|nr:thioredoxin-disulfide reductase [Faecalicoccus acidiformans]MBM6831286.1 thioredoxin-disulfide reductase [Faecalicoccus acidiformans]MDM8203259.1 thioredoxin-disulfide reductase [Faecalicoccus acidiformans]HIW17660.1 thioredoxin-disulfide reductase [Candidatus Faecalicoccus intestinipullorum]